MLRSNVSAQRRLTRPCDRASGRADGSSVRWSNWLDAACASGGLAGDGRPAYTAAMNARVDHILTEALELPADERSALVVALLDTLEGSTDASISAAWRDEIRQRRQALKSGALKPVPWAEARGRLSAL